MSLSLDLLFQYRLGELERGERDGNDRQAFEDRIQSRAALGSAGLQGFPELPAGEDDQRHAADDEQQADDEMADRTDRMKHAQGIAVCSGHVRLVGSLTPSARPVPP